MTEIPIEKRSVAERIGLVRTMLEGIITDSPSLVPEHPSLEQISCYSHAVFNLSQALDDLSRATEYLTKGGK